MVTLLHRTTGLLRDDDALLDELSLALDPTDARALAAAPVSLARRAVRRLLTVDGYPPDAAAVSRVLAVAFGEAAACEVTGVGRVQRSSQRLRIVPCGPATEPLASPDPVAAQAGPATPGIVEAGN